MSDAPLKVDESWICFTSAGQKFIGRRVMPSSSPVEPSSPGSGEELDDGLYVDPAYELREVQVAMGKGGNAMGIQVFPVFMFCDSAPMSIEPDNLIEVGALSEADRKMVVQWVRMGEEARQNMKAQRVGLSLVRS